LPALIRAASIRHCLTGDFGNCLQGSPECPSQSIGSRHSLV
jgi:hypothetical protein